MKLNIANIHPLLRFIHDRNIQPSGWIEFTYKKSNVLQEKKQIYNCNKTNCCVYEKGNKCMAGNEDGPLFNSDEYGKTKDTIYYYKEKCYGC